MAFVFRLPARSNLLFACIDNGRDATITVSEFHLFHHCYCPTTLLRSCAAINLRRPEVSEPDPPDRALLCNHIAGKRNYVVERATHGLVQVVVPRGRQTSACLPASQRTDHKSYFAADEQATVTGHLHCARTVLRRLPV